MEYLIFHACQWTETLFAGHRAPGACLEKFGKGGEDTTAVYIGLTEHMAWRTGAIGKRGSEGGSDNDAMKLGTWKRRRAWC
jgi:hypothetical protein